MILDLAKVRPDREQRFIVCLDMGNGDELSRPQADRTDHDDPREDC